MRFTEQQITQTQTVFRSRNPVVGSTTYFW